MKYYSLFIYNVWFIIDLIFPIIFLTIVPIRVELNNKYFAVLYLLVQMKIFNIVLSCICILLCTPFYHHLLFYLNKLPQLKHYLQMICLTLRHCLYIISKTKITKHSNRPIISSRYYLHFRSIKFAQACLNTANVNIRLGKQSLCKTPADDLTYIS